MSTHKQLDVYQRSFKVALAIYRFSRSLPNYLQYDIADDMRRATRSVPSNIAEGYGRNKSKKDTVIFLKTSLGSNDEVIFNLEFIYGLKLIEVERYNKATKEYEIIGKQLNKLIHSLS